MGESLINNNIPTMPISGGWTLNRAMESLQLLKNDRKKMYIEKVNLKKKNVFS